MKSTKTSLLRIFQQSFRSTVSESDPSRRKFVKQSVLGAGAALVGSAWLESFSVSKTSNCDFRRWCGRIAQRSNTQGYGY